MSRARPLLLAVAMAWVTACTAAPPGPEAATAPSHRLAAIREARAAVGGPAAAVILAAQQTSADLDALRAQPSRDPEVRRRRAEELRTEAGEALAGATSTARRVDLDLAVADVARAARALEQGLDAAEQVRATMLDEVAAISRAATAEIELAHLVAAWSEPGSRDTQIERLAQAANEAAALAERLGSERDTVGCMTTFDRRAAAARTVAERTTVLRDLVLARRGTEFDLRRDEFIADPYGDAPPLDEGDRGDLPCWRAQAPVQEAVERLEREFEEVERALNPADLADGDSAP